MNTQYRQFHLTSEDHVITETGEVWVTPPTGEKPISIHLVSDALKLLTIFPDAEGLRLANELADRRAAVRARPHFDGAKLYWRLIEFHAAGPEGRPKKGLCHERITELLPG